MNCKEKGLERNSLFVVEIRRTNYYALSRNYGCMTVVVPYEKVRGWLKAEYVSDKGDSL